MTADWIMREVLTGCDQPVFGVADFTIPAGSRGRVVQTFADAALVAVMVYGYGGLTVVYEPKNLTVIE